MGIETNLGPILTMIGAIALFGLLLVWWKLARRRLGVALRIAAVVLYVALVITLYVLGFPFSFLGFWVALFGVVGLVVWLSVKGVRSARRTAARAPQPAPVQMRPALVRAPHEERMAHVLRTAPDVFDACGLFVVDVAATDDYRETEASLNQSDGGVIDAGINIFTMIAQSKQRNQPGVVVRRGQLRRVPVVTGCEATEAIDTLWLSLPHGLTMQSVVDAGDMLRHAYTAHRVVVSQNEDERVHGVIRLVIMYADVLSGVRESRGVEDEGAITVGRLDDGGTAVVDFADASHIAIQGMTRSGKSAFCYTMLSPLAKHDDVIVGGIDPNRVLLRPWANVARSEPWIVVGSDAAAAAELLDRYIAELDARMLIIDERGIEKIDDFTPDLPLHVVVLEEYPGLLRIAKGYDADQKPADRVGARILRAVERLVSEGAKAGFRVILLAQRMDASIVDGATRGQFGTRVTFAVDNADGVRMLHPQATPELIEQVTTFPPGRAIFWRHRATAMLQADYTEYAEYRRRLEPTA